MNEAKQKILNIILYAIIYIPLIYLGIKILTMITNVTNISTMFNGLNEVRDYVSFRLTHYIMEGINPFTPEFLNEEKVPFLICYSALNPICVAILCKLTKISVISGFIVCNLLWWILTCYNIWLIVKDFFDKYKYAVILCIAINAATFFTMFNTPIFTFRADAIGIFITSIILLIVYKNKQLTLPLAILTILLIFTKQFLIIFAVPLFVYYLLTDKKLAVKFFWQYFLIGIITFCIVQWLFPLYWSESILGQFYPNNYPKWEAINIIFLFYCKYFLYIVLMLLAIIGIIYIQKKSNNLFSIIKDIKENHEYIIYLVLNIIFGTLSLLYLGQAEDDAHKYCRDILSLSLFVLSVYIWNKYFAIYLFKEIKTEIKEAILVFALCLVSVMMFNKFDFNYRYTIEDIKNFIELDSIIATHEEETIYLGIYSSQYMLNRNIWDKPNILFNDGHFEWLTYYHTENPIIKKFFYSQEIEKALQAYYYKIHDMIRNKEFKFLTLSSLNNVIDMDTLRDNYYQDERKYSINSPNSIVDVTVWYPKE